MKTNINVEVLSKAIIARIKEIAEPKTDKYFINCSDETKFEERVMSVIKTLVVLIAKSDSSTIQVDDESFGLSDYFITDNMQKLVDANEVYFAEGTEDVVAPYFKVVATDYEDEILSPSKFNGFFNQLRSTLSDPDQYTKACSALQRGKHSYLFNFEALVADETSLAVCGGTNAGVPDYVSQILSIQTPNLARDVLKCYPMYKERGLGEWLLK